MISLANKRNKTPSTIVHMYILVFSSDLLGTYILSTVQYGCLSGLQLAIKSRPPPLDALRPARAINHTERH